MVTAITAAARELFRTSFGSAPTAVARAPGRVNLIGEHVDYAEGFVLPMAIERHTVVAIGSARQASRFVSQGFGEVRCAVAEPLQPLAGEAAWANYVVGPLRELAEAGIVSGEVNVAVASSVPAGGGVSSSAAIEVATTLAALSLARASLDGLAIASLCQRAEHRFAGTPCGIMDMTVSANATAGHALLVDCRSLSLRHVPMPSGASLLVVDSGVRHRLSDGGYASRRTAVEEAARRLGVRTLRDASCEDVAAADLDDLTRRRARHVTGEIARTLAAAEALATSDVRRFGSLMLESHASLRDDFAVSVPELDAIVDSAMAAPGALGARMTGGGFGGCAIVLAEQDHAGLVADSIADAFGRRFGRPPTSFVTKAAAGAALEG